jgi:hypothetical protein
MIRTAPIKEPGFMPRTVRVSVMSRHTDSGGKKPDPSITDDLFDLHFPILGPPPKLIGAYYRKEIGWPEFECGYRKHLMTPEVQRVIRSFLYLSIVIDVVFMCIESTPDRCHRRLLLEECKRISPDLVVDLK